MSNSAAVEEIRTLVDALRADRFTAEQTARLDELVCTDDDACWAYVQQRHQDAVLRMTLTRQVLGRMYPVDVPGQMPPAEAFALPPSTRWQRLSTWIAEPGTVSLLTATAAVSIVLLVLAALTVPSFRGLGIEHAAVPKAEKTVATITRTFNARWANASSNRTVGAVIAQGELIELAKGLIEIEFHKGTKVVVEGPAELQADGHNSGSLSRGKLVAQVPGQAVGFSLRTPTATLTDLGTEFGVAVDEAGKTEVHVFQGMVEARFTSAPAEQPAKILMAGQSARLNDSSDKVQIGSGNAESLARDFTRTIPSKTKHGVTKNLVVKNPSFEIPDIRKHPEYRARFGNLRRIPLGWHAPPMSDESSKQRRVLYQRSPYRESSASTLGPGATDGEQVALVWLHKLVEKSGHDTLATWLYQSLGIVTVDDVGKTLCLSADVTARTQLEGAIKMHDGAAAEVAFAVDVSDRGKGNTIGTPGQVPSLQRGHGVCTPRAVLTIGPELIDRELSIRLTVKISETIRDTSFWGQYHFDNVRCSVKEKTLQNDRGHHYSKDATENYE